MADYYQLLGVSSAASVEEIRAAYRKCAISFHPDRHPGDDEIARKFCEISRAYDVLADAEQRRAYDQTSGTEKPKSLFDSLSDEIESALAIFGKVSSFFEVQEPKKRSECTACGGTGETVLDLGLITITQSCPDCESEKPSPVNRERP